MAAAQEARRGILAAGTSSGSVEFRRCQVPDLACEGLLVPCSPIWQGFIAQPMGGGSPFRRLAVHYVM